MYDDGGDSQDFLSKMDAGDFDQNLSTEIKKLSKQQLEEVVELLIKRDSDSTRKSSDE
jgi:hypothetical protein